MAKDFLTYLNDFNISYDLDKLSLLEKFCERLVLENEKFNLTSITEKSDVFLLHFLDSLLALPFIPNSSSVLDIGSGGGLPAIPLKIFLPQIKMTMVDSVNKKVNFLSDTASIFNLKDCEAIHTRIEDLARSGRRASFDVVTSRAVAKLPTLLEYAIPLLKVGGIFISYKSDYLEELKSCENALYFLNAKLQEVKTYSYENYSRSILIFTKTGKTPSMYPRGKNKERTDPLL